MLCYQCISHPCGAEGNAASAEDIFHLPSVIVLAVAGDFSMYDLKTSYNRDYIELDFYESL